MCCNRSILKFLPKFEIVKRKKMPKEKVGTIRRGKQTHCNQNDTI